MADPIPTVRTFVSYSWSNPAHQSWVLGLAKRLVEDGIEVVLDKWDLKPGHDAIQFMEQMVTDATISKVMLIFDKTYVEKADGRAGGVGTESQIVSPELYGKGKQNKFGALITETDESGKAYLPTYYKSRIYFDFSDDRKFEDSYEELLRWLLGRPAFVKPKLGSVPAHLLGESSAPTPSESKWKRAEAAIKSGSGALAAIREFGASFLEEFKGLIVVERNNNRPLDDIIYESIDSSRPFSQQIESLAQTICYYDSSGEMFDQLLRLVEGVLANSVRPEHVHSWTDGMFDNVAFLAQEIFLGVLAVTLKEERFDLSVKCLTKAFVHPTSRGGTGRSTGDYSLFGTHLRSLEVRNSRLDLKRRSLHADLLSKRFQNGILSFDEVMQADFVCYLRSALRAVEGHDSSWWPETLLYASNRYKPFEIFMRAESASYLGNILKLLSVKNLDELREKISKVANGSRVPRYSFHSLNVAGLSNLENLGVAD